jgi:hypothetical protein
MLPVGENVFALPAASGGVVARRRLSTAGVMSRCVLVFIAMSFQRFSLLLPFQVQLVSPLRTSGAKLCEGSEVDLVPKKRKRKGGRLGVIFRCSKWLNSFRVFRAFSS